LRVDIAIFRSGHFYGRQLGALARLGHTHAALLPRLFAFLQGGVVEFATAARYKRHRLLLFRRRREVVLVCLAHRLLVHSALFCLIGTKTAMWRAPILRLKAEA